MKDSHGQIVQGSSFTTDPELWFRNKEGYTFQSRYIPEGAVPAHISATPELAVTCPDCHAPVGVGCVTIVWRAEDGQFVPSCQPRHPHSRRRKRLEKYGASISRPARVLTAEDMERIAERRRTPEAKGE